MASHWRPGTAFFSLSGKRKHIVFHTSVSWQQALIEPWHDNTNKMCVRPLKTRISLGIRPVWSASSLSAWRNHGSLTTQWVHSKDSDQTWRMPRLIWVFARRKLIVLVLSCRGSIVNNPMLPLRDIPWCGCGPDDFKLLSTIVQLYEPRHDKTNKMSVCPAKTQISLGICPVWSKSSPGHLPSLIRVFAVPWVAKDTWFLHADSEDSEQTGQMPRLIWDSEDSDETGRMPRPSFHWALTHFVILSCWGSCGQRQANLVLIAYASSEGSGEPAHLPSLARTFAARSYKQWVKRNHQTESQVPGSSEWLGMRS